MKRTVGTVLTIGTFDLLHPGHLDLLRACRDLAGAQGHVVVAVNPSDFVERFKRRRPVQELPERMEMLRACRMVDAVIVNFGEERAGPVIDAVAPDLLVIGDDWKGRDYLGQLHIDQAFLDHRGLSIEYVPRVRDWSTTGIRAAINETPASCPQCSVKPAGSECIPHVHADGWCTPHGHVEDPGIMAITPPGAFFHYPGADSVWHRASHATIETSGVQWRCRCGQVTTRDCSWWTDPATEPTAPWLCDTPGRTVNRPPWEPASDTTPGSRWGTQ